MMDESRQKILSDRSYHTLPPPEPPAIPITVTSFVILGVLYYYGLAFEGGVLCDAEESLACKFTVSLIFTLMEERPCTVLSLSCLLSHYSVRTSRQALRMLTVNQSFKQIPTLMLRKFACRTVVDCRSITHITHQLPGFTSILII